MSAVLEPGLSQTEALVHLSLIEAILQSSSWMKPMQQWVSSVYVPIVVSVADREASLPWVSCMDSINLKIS